MERIGMRDIKEVLKTLEKCTNTITYYHTIGHCNILLSPPYRPNFISMFNFHVAHERPHWWTTMYTATGASGLARQVPRKRDLDIRRDSRMCPQTRTNHFAVS